MAESNSFFLEIVSPLGIIFEGEADSVSIPTFDGRITVLANHAPLLAKLSEGEVELKQNKKNTTIVIAGGFLEVKNNSVYVLSDYAVRAESIEIAKSEAKKKQAEEKLKEKLDREDFAIADKDLRLSILELKVAQKIRRKQRLE